MAYDGLTDAFDHIPMGESTERHIAKLGITRAEQDEFAARSQQRAAAAQKNGLFEAEIVPVEIPQRKGDPIVVKEDEGIRGDTTAESLGRLRPAFTKDGTITAGNASPISDGAAAVVVMSQGEGRGAGPDLAGRDRCARHRRRPGQLAAVAAVQRDQRGAGQGGADGRRPRPDRDQRGVRCGRPSSRCVTSASTEEKVNVNGGAIALGHPIGMSGARLVLHLALELQRRGGGVGAAALCGGGGQGDALIVTVPKRA